MSAPKTRKTRPLLARDVQVYRLCEDLTESLIYPMAVLSPWAFGTTDGWAMWVMNGAGYAVGVMLLVKLSIRWFKGYRPLRWNRRETTSRQKIISALALLTIAIPIYCLIGALNARATYQPEMLGFDYHEYIKWLPATFDSANTWFIFWCSLALSCSFWSVRDWLLGKTAAEERAERVKLDLTPDDAPLLPGRWRRLLWVLTINGGLLGVEGIIQRLANCPKLLFMVLPTVHQTADTQFGPYAYRSSAAQYFNLLWPVSLGFWRLLQGAGEAGRNSRLFALICASIMAACPIISTTRGGALVSFGLLALATFFIAVTPDRSNATVPGQRPSVKSSPRIRTSLALVIFLIGSLALGILLGWKTLKPRMAQISEGYDYRERMYQNAAPMAADYPIYGIGPGAFVHTFQLYRVATSTYWPPELHNDWLEARISFGWVGSGMIAAAFLLLGFSFFSPGGIPGHGRFATMLYLAMGGCMVHALFDFPFHIYSVVFLFVIWCAMIANLSRKSAAQLRE